MSYKIGEIIISTSSVNSAQNVESSTSTVRWRPARQITNGSTARCTITFNNGLELTAYIFDRDSKRRVFWPKDVRFKNHLLKKIIEKSVLNKYKVFMGQK
jgi:hypothetical protein